MTRPPEIDDALAALRRGAVVAVPTDTVYGLAVDPTHPGATDALFSIKGRPAGSDLPVLVASIEDADRLAGPAGLGPTSRHLAEVFWPGALTIVVARRSGLGWALGEHVTTIGLRCPDHVLARRLCADIGPLATTSANLHGLPPCTDAAAVHAVFADRIAAIVDGGRCDGAPSTVVDVTGEVPRCLRVGAIAWTEVVGAADRFVTGSR
jgi:tRNA threonylcarbamoyl adenosine modification protein (Sua5/YciO/YrdC/YwlC family)